jgi:hypothetical protein
MLHPARDEGLARLLLRDDAFSCARHPRSDSLEAGHPLDRRGGSRPEAGSFPDHPAQRGWTQGTCCLHSPGDEAGDLSDLLLLVDEDRQQRAATVLVDVAYVIEARFEMTAKAGPSDNEGKHLDSFNRRARKGQCFHQPSLGTREFPARFRLIEPGQALPPAIDETRDLGFMLYDIDHGGDRSSLFFRARLDTGVMLVPAADSPEIRR